VAPRPACGHDSQMMIGFPAFQASKARIAGFFNRPEGVRPKIPICPLESKSPSCLSMVGPVLPRETLPKLNPRSRFAPHRTPGMDKHEKRKNGFDYATAPRARHVGRRLMPVDGGNSGLPGVPVGRSSHGGRILKNAGSKIVPPRRFSPDLPLTKVALAKKNPGLQQKLFRACWPPPGLCQAATLVTILASNLHPTPNVANKGRWFFFYAGPSPGNIFSPVELPDQRRPTFPPT